MITRPMARALRQRDNPPMPEVIMAVIVAGGMSGVSHTDTT